MKDIFNSSNSNSENPLIDSTIPNVSEFNNIKNPAPIPNLNNEINKKSRFPIAENNIIGFK